MTRFNFPLAPEMLDKHTLFAPAVDSKDADFDTMLRAVKSAMAQEFAGLELLKSARQRLVLRMPYDGQTVILKLFPLSNPASRLRYKKYALREFQNYDRARAAGIPSPRCFGYIERRSFGFVNLCGVILEDLAEYRDALQLSAHGGYVQAAMRCIAPLGQLYETGVNHIDARDENILFRADVHKIIDWQYASFVEPRAAWFLEHLSAYFIRKAPEVERVALENIWLWELHTTAAHGSEFDTFQTRVKTLLANRQGTRARLALRPA